MRDWPLNEKILPSNIQRIERMPRSHTFECNVCEGTESGVILSNRELLMFCNWHYSRSPECFEAQPPPIPLLPKVEEEEEEPLPSNKGLVGRMVEVTAGVNFTSNNPKKTEGTLKRGGRKKVVEEGRGWVRWKSGSYWIQVRSHDVI